MLIDEGHDFSPEWLLLLSPVEAGDDGGPRNEMGVFYTAKFVGGEIANALERLKVPFDWPSHPQAQGFDPLRPSVKLLTPHSSKGLQFRVCVIGGVRHWPYPTPHQTEAEQARLLYVAMTRATHELVLTSSRGSRFSERLMALCA